MYTLNDYDFERPSVDLVTKQKVSRKHGESDYEMFDYPGEYIQKSDGEQFVQTRLDELQSQYELANANSNCRGAAAGCLFKLTGQPRDDQNREYLIVAATHQLEFSEYEGDGRRRCELQLRLHRAQQQAAVPPAAPDAQAHRPGPADRGRRRARAARRSTPTSTAA